MICTPGEAGDASEGFGAADRRVAEQGSRPPPAKLPTRSRRTDSPPFSRAPERWRPIRSNCCTFVAERVVTGGFSELGLVVTVDDDVRPDLLLLPCGDLWD
jgi:hypothetical protein